MSLAVQSSLDALSVFGSSTVWMFGRTPTSDLGRRPVFSSSLFRTANWMCRGAMRHLCHGLHCPTAPECMRRVNQDGSEVDCRSCAPQQTANLAYIKLATRPSRAACRSLFGDRFLSTTNHLGILRSRVFSVCGLLKLYTGLLHHGKAHLRQWSSLPPTGGNSRRYKSPQIFNLSDVEKVCQVKPILTIEPEAYARMHDIVKKKNLTIFGGGNTVINAISVKWAKATF
ncbi:hypothetical protein J4Q44_G00048650 [Coregonus suidteri]|uniref:Uncharacterized protein n=1 Tax=Coregonus suidteri TaxID=861788 RepID=A0AAN8MES3_9TELE